MNRFLILICALVWGISACQKPLINNNNTGGGGTSNAHWTKVGFETERNILNLHATPFQLYAITENEFVRFDFDNQLLELRNLPTGNGVKGIPALSDNIFMRLTTGAQASQLIEFRLARNPEKVWTIPADSLKMPGDDHLEIEFLSRRLGAFSDDGILFLLPAKRFSAQGNHFIFFLFEFAFNATFDDLSNVSVAHRIEVPELSADFGNISNIRFIHGNFYVATKEGAFRLTPDGEYEQIFPQWMLDFFPYDGKIYATGISSFDLHVSEDDGETWERLNMNSELKLVEAVGAHLFTQEVEGYAFKLVEEDLLKASDIDYGPDIDPDNLSAFYGLAWYNDLYYFNVGRAIYFTNEIVRK